MSDHTRRMIMKTKAQRRLKVRLVRSVVLGFAAAATVVPAAQARLDIDGGATVATQSAVIPYLSHGVGLADNPATALVRSDGTDGVRPAMPAAFVRSDGPDGVRPQTPVVSVSVNAVDDGFEWQPYGIAAASGIALALLAAASLAGIRRRDRVALT
jgi:hypothetical protein